MAPLRKEANRFASLTTGLVSLLAYSLILYFLSCVGGLVVRPDSPRADEYLAKAWVSTPRRVEFVHNNLYESDYNDANGDGMQNIQDVIATINDVLGISYAQGDPDCNSDGKVDIKDVICINNEILYGSEDELQDAISTVDEYLVEALECAKSVYPELSARLDALGGLEVVVVFPDLFNSKTRNEGFTCSASSTGCTGLYKEGRASILITPSLAALGHEMGHWINDELFGGTDHSPQDLSIQCNLPRICHLYSVNRNLDGC